MSRATYINWSDVEAAANEMAGNWRNFESFCWHKSYDLDDPDAWTIIYTSNRDSGLLAQSNEQAINEMLDKYTEGDDPDIVFERHSHWAVGHVDGFSVRVYRPDGTITDAFKEVCRIQERLEDYPLLDESDYSERELEATLENYRSEIGHYRSDLPDGWESEVYRHFSDTNQYRYIESRDDQGGWAPRDALVEALIEMGLLEAEDE
jgi:hypothetical protein